MSKLNQNKQKELEKHFNEKVVPFMKKFIDELNKKMMDDIAKFDSSSAMQLATLKSLLNYIRDWTLLAEEKVKQVEKQNQSPLILPE